MNEEPGIPRWLVFGGVAAVALVIAATTALRRHAAPSASSVAEVREVTRGAEARVTRLAQSRETAVPRRSATAAGARKSQSSVGATSTTSADVSLPLRGPSGALSGNVGLTSFTQSAAGATGETPEQQQERWKKAGLQIIPVRIVDTTSHPLEGVHILVDGIHFGQAGNETGHGGWRTNKYGAAPEDVTGADGRAVVASPIILSELSEAIGISFTATKPGYSKRRIMHYPVDGKERDEVLRKGDKLIVGAYLETPERHVSGFVVHVSFASDIDPKDWTPLPDGRQSCDTMPNGKHAITVSYEEPGGMTWQSDSVPFELREGESKELDVALLPGITLHGKLSDNVPRPVSNGKVHAASEWPPPGTGIPDNGVATFREATADIAPDGTFELKGLPQGPGEIIGLCDGYIAAHRAPNAPPYQQNQRYILERSPQDVFVLNMVPAGNLRVRIVNSSGQPLPGAKLMAWPNVTWSVGLSQMYLDAKLWNATADSLGYALIKGLRPGSQPYTASAKGWGLPVTLDGAGRASRSTAAAIMPGQTTELVATLEPVPLDDNE
jgi:hypothetical protein